MIYDYGIYDPHSDTWLGNPATKYSKKYPECKRCHSKTCLKTPREIDRDGNIRPATFECIQCGCEVPDPIQFMTQRDGDDVLGELLMKAANQKD